MSGVINIKMCAGNSVDFIGSRQTGAVIREQILELTKDGHGVTLDFGGVKTITQSFADEFIGIFTRAYGVKFIIENIRTVNANDNIKKVLNFVIAYSKKKVS